jgi:hypothetical protein
MRIRFWTSALLGFGLTLVLASPVVFMRRPDAHETLEMQRWVVVAGLYVCVTAFVWVGVAALAILMIRSIRKDMAAERELNMRILLEKTLADHATDSENGSQAPSA